MHAITKVEAVNSALAISLVSDIGTPRRYLRLGNNESTIDDVFALADAGEIDDETLRRDFVLDTDHIEAVELESKSDLEEGSIFNMEMAGDAPSSDLMEYDEPDFSRFDRR